MRRLKEILTRDHRTTHSTLASEFCEFVSIFGTLEAPLRQPQRQAAHTSVVTHLSHETKQDRRGAWRFYNPDSFLACTKSCNELCCGCRFREAGDDYDPRAAPLLPPAEDECQEIRRQALESSMSHTPEDIALRLP